MNHYPPEQPDIASSTQEYRQRFSGEVGNWFLHVQQKALSQLLKIKQRQTETALKVLDVGGGHAQNIKPVLSAGHQLSVLGSKEECFGLIRAYYPNLQLQLISGSLTALPFKDRSFDICLSFRMLPHLVHWQQHISELCRVADDAVIIEFPSRCSLNLISAPLFRLKKGIEKSTRTFTLFDEKAICALFEQQGFVLTQRYAQYFFPMVLYRLINNKRVATTLEWLANRTGIQQKFGSPVICLFSREKREQDDAR